MYEVVPHDRLLGAADAWCTKIAARPAHAGAFQKTVRALLVAR